MIEPWDIPRCNRNFQFPYNVTNWLTFGDVTFIRIVVLLNNPHLSDQSNWYVIDYRGVLFQRVRFHCILYILPSGVVISVQLSFPLPAQFIADTQHMQFVQKRRTLVSSNATAIIVFVDDPDAYIRMLLLLFVLLQFTEQEDETP